MQHYIQNWKKKCYRWSSIDKVEEKPWKAVFFHSPDLIRPLQREENVFVYLTVLSEL